MIDKQYIIGYDLLNNGRLPLEYNANSPSYIKEIVIKNKIIDTILEVISSHKNLVNLTATVSTVNLKKLKDRASAKEFLDSSNPADVFNMIVENAAGKDTIGITAVAGKGFAAICYYYNDLIDRVKRLIYDGQYDNAEIVLDQIPIFPNLDYSWVDSVIRFIPETNDSLYGKLDARKQIILTSEDAYLLIGEFLNASADNAKLLILKSIYADKEWADFYIAGIMMGYKLDDIYNILLNPSVRDFINGKRGSKLYNSDKFNEYEALNTMPEDFKDVYNLSNLLQLTGKLASINQGFTTNKFDIKNKIKTIEKQVTSIVKSFLKNAGFKDDAKSYNFSLFKYLMEGDNDADIALDQNKINPLKIIFSNPLYKAQWISYLTAIQISNTLSSKNELEYGMEYKNKKEYKKNVSKLSETINKSWIASIKYKLTLPEKFRKRIEQNLTVDPEITLNDSNTETFVKYMEEYAIPKLKELYPENYFIQSLAPDIRSLENGNYTMFYKIPLNMREIDSDENVREEYGKMFRGFNSLSGIEFEGNKIHELLYLYETLVNRTFSRSSMSRFFSESFATGENALIDSHARYLENEENVDSVVKLNAVESVHTPTIYDFGDVRRASYYSEQYSGVDKLMDFEDWKNFDDMIVVFNDDDYIEVLHSYGINDEEAGMVHNIGKAFVYDGKIFINTDKATRDDLRHEISHIIIGVMKASLPSAGVILNNFYELNKSKFIKILIDLSGHSVYKNLKSSDLIEEAIAHWVAYSENNLNDFMRFVSDDKISSLNDFIKDFLSSKGTKNDFISNVSNIQKAETLRNFLMTREGNMSVKEDCK